MNTATAYAAPDGAALARLDGSDLYAAPGGPALMRDIAIAAAVGLSRPRDVRRVFARLIDSGAVAVADGADMRAQSGDPRPLVVRTVEHVQCGRGRMQASTAYYADERAAAFVVLKMRVAGAADVQRKIADTFVRVRGAGAAPAALHQAAPEHAPTATALTLPSAGDDRLPDLPEVERRSVLLCRAAEHPACPPEARAHALAAVVALLAGSLPALPAPAAPSTTVTPAAPAPHVDEPAVGPGPMVAPAQDAIPSTWISASTMAARASAALGRRVSANGCGRALALLGFHADDAAHLRRGVVVQRPHGDGECNVWRYAPQVYPEVLAYLRDLPRTTAAGARGVVDAIDGATATAKKRAA
jgi:hypothetical protein